MQAPAGGGAPGRSPAVGPGRSSGGGASSSSAASPSSSSSAVSAPHFGGVEAAHQLQQQQQQQQQQLAFRQSLQQQQFRKSVVDETLGGYQTGGIHSVTGSGTSFVPASGATSAAQPARRLVDLPQQQGSLQGREEKANQASGSEQHLQNPIHQAYAPYNAFQAAQQKSQGNVVQVFPQSNKMGVVGPLGKDQDMRVNNLKMQELMSLQAANHAQASAFKKSTEHFGHGQKQLEVGQTSDSKPQQNMVRAPLQGQPPANMSNITANQFAMVQLQAMQAWALENNIDLSHPNNANLIAQLLPLFQSKMAAMQKASDNAGAHSSQVLAVKQQSNMSSPPVVNENSIHGNSVNELKTRQMHSAGLMNSSGPSTINANNVHVSSRQHVGSGNGMPAMHPPQSPASMNQNVDSPRAKNTGSSGSEAMQVQLMRQMQQLNRVPGQPTGSSGENSNTPLPSQGIVSVNQTQPRIGFTKQQLHVLKAQILAFRRIKRGEGSLPKEVLQAIAPPPLDQAVEQIFTTPIAVNQVRSAPKTLDDQVRNVDATTRVTSQVTPLTKSQSLSKEESPFAVIDKSGKENDFQAPNGPKESGTSAQMAKEELSQISSATIKSENESEHNNQKNTVKDDPAANRGKTSLQPAASSDGMQGKQLPQKDISGPRKYHGPLFDFPYFTRRHDTFGSVTNASNMSNLTLSYDVKDLLSEEGVEILNKRKEDKLKKIGHLLAVNLERKRIRPDLVLRLRIEEKKLQLVDLQSRLRDEMDMQQQDIMAMPDRPYKKFVRLCERQRMELAKQVQITQKAGRERQLKAIFHWRKKLLEAHWAIRDARTARNRGIAKYHERMLREFSKRKDDDRDKRMEALKNNDVDRYREMLLEQQTNIPGDAAQRYTVLSSFLSQTEEYLRRLGGKITAAKNHQEIEEVAAAAAAAARSQGLSEEEVRAAASCAGEEVIIRNRFSEMNAPRDNSSNKYYNLAHVVNERVIRQPSMLRAGTLRDYQLIGLQWMLSLYNNKLNGILADEMGLGKTVQVMALIAYLMEFKGNYGPHLIIVPNAVLVNWKSELHNWLPSVSCIYYVGGKDQRSKLFSQEVCAMKFNVLVTTYEFVMYDRTKLSKIDWKYIIIDEAQRMKDRESVLARDLDRYRCQRRLLLTGTPLQNDLKELWSLLNLLLPEVFDNRKAFHDWFSKPFQKDGASESVEDDWLETEKKVIIIHRLHQILEPFMLRRRVEDVEGSLPPKISIVLRCKMSALQGAIYDWIKSTGTIRVNPEDELRRLEKNPSYQIKTNKNLNNKCMELRKACNHPLLNYPYFTQYSRDFLVRSCGKLWVLDRILIKLHRAGHRVLLFSTMTKLLDILEEYLQWRRLVYRRIDGTTALEDRESAIVDFNSLDSGCFIFLLSIRAAGRGLNLQTADTVVIYDPDPNPKNEEQAVARAHRIGQKREVKVIYMEAVVDKISSHQKEDELRSGGMVDMEDDFAGKDRYIGSIESLIRNNIQQYKIDMADEVINAGRFDQRTTHEERRMTLEALLHDEERYQENVHDVPSLQEVNRMIARSEEEVELFDQMDEDYDWVGEMIHYDQVPEWIRAGSHEVNSLLASLSKKSSKGGLVRNAGLEPGQAVKDLSPSMSDRRRGRSKDSRRFSYRELDDENGDDSEASSQEGNEYGLNEEEGDVGDSEEEESSGGADVEPINKEHSEEGDPPCDDTGGYGALQDVGSVRNSLIYEEAISTASSSESQRLAKVVASPIVCQKFGSLSALDARSDSLPRRMPDELEEGEIAVSGDSHMDYQQSGSWVQDRDDGEEEQVVQPKIKRKRSIRIRPRYNIEKLEERSNMENLLTPRSGNFSQLSISVERRPIEMQVRADSEHDAHSYLNASDSHDPVDSIPKHRRNMSARKGASASSTKWSSAKPARLNIRTVPAQDASEQSRESWDGRASTTHGAPILSSGTKMSEIVQRKCKNVSSKFQKRIAKDGHQIAPLMTDFLKRTGTSFVATNDMIDLRKIDQKIDRLQYSGVMDFVTDVQLMLKSLVQCCGYTYEGRTEARKLQDVFFDILKIAFPGADLREARSALTFSGPGPGGTQTSTQATTGQIRRQKNIQELEQERSSARQMPSRATLAKDDLRSRSQSFKLQKGTKVNSRDSGTSGDAPIPTHPGELVICKKKRKDREKAPLLKPRPGHTSPVGVSRTPLLGSSKQSQQAPSHSYGWAQRSASQPQPKQQRFVDAAGGTVNEAQWAKPVKRLRTDTGKRRPSQL